MNEESARFLISAEGQPFLETAANLSGDKPTRVLLLRKRGQSPERAALAVEVVLARERAKRRGIPDAERLFFTEESLAQATSPALAVYRAARLAPFGTVADLCCGIGMDAIALAEAGAKRVIAVDVDAARLTFARANAEVRGVADRIAFLCEPAEALGWLPADAAFFDPARRTDTTRVSRHADRYAPPLDFLETVRAHVRGGAAKLSPALPDDVLAELAATRIEFLSENRECKEACVWFGEASGVSGTGEDFAAVLLGGSHPLPLPHQNERGESGRAFADLGSSPLPPSLETPLSHSDEGGAGGGSTYLLDPDPALIRAGVLEAFCETVGASRISSEDAYLTTNALPSEPWDRAALAYRVQEILPYTPKKVAPKLRERGIRRIVVKKRHFPQEPDAVARELGVAVRGDGPEMTLVLVRDFGKRFLAVLCEPV